MAALVQSEFTATVTWLGRVARREDGIASASAEWLALDLDGAEGEAHSGLTRPCCSRFSMLHPKGTPIANSRQLSILSEEELALIAAGMGLPAIDPAWLGASIVLKGIPDLSHVPPASRLQGPGGVTLTVDLENGPCQFPAKVIEAAQPGFGAGFIGAARGRRGITAWVEREGSLALGDVLRLFVPTQPAWAPLSPA